MASILERGITNEGETDYGLRSTLICKFANMGLSGREISRAIEIETEGKLVITPRTIKTLVFQRRRRNQIRELTPEERVDIEDTTANPFDYTDKVMDQDVRAILKAVKKLEEEGKPLPQNRLDLKKFRISQNGESAGGKGDGVRIGKTIVFSDGTHIPTFTGMKHDPSRNEKNSNVHRDKQESEEKVRKQSGVFEFIGPLCMRLPQVSPLEWASIAQFTTRPLNGIQITAAINRKGRPEWHNLPSEFYLPENARARRVRGNEFGSNKKRGAERFTKGKAEINEGEKSQRLVAHFMDRGIFSWDISVFKEVRGMYEKHKKPLPQNPADLLIAEIYLLAIKQLIKCDGKLMREYTQAANEIDPQFFAETEGFVKAKFFTQWADGEDKKGFFEINGDGTISRHFVLEDGGYVRETSAIHIRRMQLRNFISK